MDCLSLRGGKAGAFEMLVGVSVCACEQCVCALWRSGTRASLRRIFAGEEDYREVLVVFRRSFF